MKKGFLASLALFAALALGASAQVVPEGAVSLSVSPPVPAPGGSVVLSAESFTLDLSRALMTWAVDGKIVARERGKTKLATAVGEFGSSMTVSLLAESPEGVSAEATAVVTPAAAELLWQADSYAPPFYRGKALPAADAAVTVFAVPHLPDGRGGEVPAGSLVYTWRQDGRVLGDASGYGKRSLKTTGPRLGRATRISVEAETLDRGVRVEQSVLIEPAEPFVRFYELDPLRGLRFERALAGSYALPGEETTLVAYPFFFSAPSAAHPSLGYSWSVNGSPTENPSPRKTMITLRQTAAGEGSAELALDITNAARLLQFARGALTLTFGN